MGELNSKYNKSIKELEKYKNNLNKLTNDINNIK
jgi:DNA integrity scanning protein DisA with diadenylate cyclase activity